MLMLRLMACRAQTAAAGTQHPTGIWPFSQPFSPSASQPARPPHLQHIGRQLSKAGEVLHQALEALQLVALLRKKPGDK
jgi:hypothetical protein